VTLQSFDGDAAAAGAALEALGAGDESDGKAMLHDTPSSLCLVCSARGMALAVINCPCIRQAV
jgi:hypothetical protein